MAQIGTVKVETPNGIKELPVFDEADSGSSVFEIVKVETPSGIGFIPMVEDSGDASFPYIKVQTANHGVVHANDTASLLPAAGTKFWVLDHDNHNIDEYDVSTAFDLTTATHSTQFDYSSESTDSFGDIAWSADGTKFYLAKEDGNIYEYGASTAFDISTLSFNDSLNESDGLPRGIAWSGDGSTLLEVGTASDKIYEYDVSTAWDVSTASLTDSQDISGTIGNQAGCAVNSDGKKWYTAGLSNETLYSWSMTTAFDVSTQSTENSKNFSGVSAVDGIFDLVWNDDGTVLWTIDNSEDDIHRYTLTTAYDISTASHDSTPLDTSSETGQAVAMTWNGATQYSGFNG